MKSYRNIAVLFSSFVVLLSFVLFSCEIPESISIKSVGAKYSVPLGHTRFKIAEKFSAEKVQDAIGDESANINVYEFNPTQNEDAVIEYLMNYPVAKQNLTLAGGLNISKPALAVLPLPIELELGTFTATLDTGINFKDILDSLAASTSSDDEERTDYSYIFNRIGFSGIEAFAYIECTGIQSKNITFTGQIVASDTENDMVGANAKILADGIFNPVTTDIDLAKMADKDGVIVDDDFIQTGKYSVKLDVEKLTDFINGDEDADGNLKKHDKFYINYKLTPKIKFAVRNDLDDFLGKNDDLSVTVNIILRFPLRLKVISDIVIDDLLDLAGNAVEDDLLNRDDGEGSDFSKYVDIVEKLECEYSFTNTTGLEFSSQIVSNEVDGQKVINDKSVSFDSLKHNFEFDKDEIKNIFEISPFKPKMAATISKTTSADTGNYLSITRNAEFGAWAVFKATTGGEVEIWSRKSREDE